MPDELGHPICLPGPWLQPKPRKGFLIGLARSRKATQRGTQSPELLGVCALLETGVQVMVQEMTHLGAAWTGHLERYLCLG